MGRWLSWDRVAGSIRRGSARFITKFGEALRKGTGVVIGDAQKAIAGFSDRAMDTTRSFQVGFNRVKFELVPEFVNWNKLENWKDIKTWEPKRIGSMVLYIIVFMVSCQKLYLAIQAPRIAREKKELTEAFMEALIPDPTRSNVRKLLLLSSLRI